MTDKKLDLNPGDSIVLNNTSGNVVMQYFRVRATKPGSEENEILCALLESKVYFHNKHETEQKYPEQTRIFREVIEKMYQVHLEKNADYSPMNILATGIVGLATRIWDKTARICNLLGFNLQTGEFSRERGSSKDESIEDNLLDLAVYCIIALIYRAGKWGK